MKKDSTLFKYLRISIITLLIVVGGYVSASYTPPVSVPTSSNTDEPIDISSNPQAKSGRLVIGTSDLSSLSEYFFSSLSGLSYVQRVFTNTLTLKDGTERDGYVLTATDDDGLATWMPEPAGNSLASSKMYVHDFRMYVRRNAGTINVDIPSEFDYCAISQMGPDFANSGGEDINKISSCAVNQVAPAGSKKWTMTGQRGNDPSFWCNARCFSLNRPIIVVPNEDPVIPVAKQYYCKGKSVNPPGNSQWDNFHWGCSTLIDFDPEFTRFTTQYISTDMTLAERIVFISSWRTTFANEACGVGQWDVSPLGGSVNAREVGFACN